MQQGHNLNDIRVEMYKSIPNTSKRILVYYSSPFSETLPSPKLKKIVKNIYICMCS